MTGRVLFVVPPFAGHVNPTLGVGAELRRRGYTVAWCGDPRLVPGAYPAAVPGQAPRPDGLSGFPALRHLWERVLLPLAEAMTPGVRAAVDHFRPDLLVVDQQALAGAVVATSAGLPWATSATTSGELAGPLAGLPRVREWLTGLLAPLGVPGDPRFSPHLVLAYTTPELTGSDAGVPVRYVGPVPREVQDAGFPWERLEPGYPLVYVTLGTVSGGGARFLGECVAALAARTHLRAVVADPHGVVRDPPGTVLVYPWVPQPALLRRAAAVICHAGHNTTCEALAAGVPLVVAPITDDQPVVAEQVVNAGAGVRLRFRHATTERIGGAVDAVLADPGYREAAHRVRVSFDRAGGAVAAADHLECLLPSRRRAWRQVGSRQSPGR
ncbi:glycosyltransferase [Amycolatopsis suaedae]|uniref:glycosyltransferase n=1 Tax=Amycolatopsis suaedae TaxID=2510978 RepID=UPI0013EF30D1|nr:nucleotide disphospho-sugar-binding domain-containing protein [Amycolatopsis suaedae]